MYLGRVQEKGEDVVLALIILVYLVDLVHLVYLVDRDEIKTYVR
jgi:hypothetical protein